MNSPDKLLNGSQAAEFLGVKAATLYAYASRGMIESQAAKNGRERRYKLSDLIRLRQSSRGYKTSKDDDQAVWTGPVIKSSVTEICPDGHRYRGKSAIDLASANTPFETVAEYLWEADDAKRADWRQVKPLDVPKQFKTLASAEMDFLDLLKLLLPLIELNDPIRRKLLSEDVVQTARRVIVTMAMKIGLSENRDQYFSDETFPIANSLLFALAGSRSPERVRLVNCALVLCADHELNASTLAARVAASCDASLYSCLLSALGSFSGSLHGSASRRAEDIVSSSLRFKTANAWLKDYLKQSETIPGFGTELYAKGDPRARLLIDFAGKVGSKDVHLIRLLEIVECVREQLSAEPNIDVALAALSYTLSLPPGSGSTIFAISRTAGWIAHAIEQRKYGGMIRPRARYIGKS